MLAGYNGMPLASVREQVPHGTPSRSSTPSSSLANFEALLSASRRTSASPQATTPTHPDNPNGHHEYPSHSATAKGKGRACTDGTASNASGGLPQGPSIIIVGMPGVGKSTLAVIAATYLECPLIDIDRTLAHRFEMPVADFIRRNGESLFRQYESQLLAEVLATLESTRSQPHMTSSNGASTSSSHTTDNNRSPPKPCVIACGGGICDNEENRAQLLLFRNRGGTVIHVHRDKHVVVPNLRESTSIVFGTDERRVRDLWHRRMPLYEAIASYTFVNATADIGHSRAAYSGLALKTVERDFLGFLKFILADEPPALDALVHRSYLATMRSARPFAMSPGELAQALIGAAAVEITPESLDPGFSPPPTPHADKNGMQHMTAAHTVAHIRRHANLPIVCALGTATTNDLSLGRKTNHDMMLSNVLDAFRLGVEIVAVDGDIPDESMAVILTAKPRPVRLMLCYRLDGPDPADWALHSITGKIQHARNRGVDLVRIVTSPRDPLSFASVYHILQEGTGHVILQSIGPHCNSTLLYNKYLTPISVPTSRPHIGNAILSFQETQKALLLSGITYTQYIRVAQATSTPIEWYSQIEKAIQFLSLPLQLAPASGGLSPVELDSSILGVLIEAAVGAEISASELSDSARATGMYTVVRNYPRLYEDVVPTALADTLVQYLSPVNAVTSRSMAIIIGGFGPTLRRAFASLRCMRFKSVYTLGIDEHPMCDLTVTMLPANQADATEILRRFPPTVVILGTNISGFPSALIDAVFASSTGGCVLSLGSTGNTQTSPQTSQITKYRPGWNAVEPESLYSAIVSLEFRFLTTFGLPQLQIIS